MRGLYGEGTEALGNLFQVSNQHTLGEKEIEIVARLEKVIRQIIEHEKMLELRYLKIEGQCSMTRLEGLMLF